MEKFWCDTGSAVRTMRWHHRNEGMAMAGALVEIWLMISAVSSLAILCIALSHSDWRFDRRIRPHRPRTGSLKRRQTRPAPPRVLDHVRS
jgi:hypothetical protein